MADYKSAEYRLVNIGLNLRDAPDKVGEGSWLRLHNIRSTQEGQIQPREGFSPFVSTGIAAQVHSIQRLDESTLIIGAGTSLFRNGTIYSTGGYSGNPLSLVAYRPNVSSTAWAYIGDSLQMRKVKSDGTDYKWGITGPTNPLSFASGGPGNLNSSVAGGTVYDWRATYRSSSTGAESNPSPVQSGLALTNEQASISVTASTDPQVDEIRLYRRGGTLGVGSSESFWTLSFTAPNVSGNVIDNNADSTIAANEILSLDRDVPFTSIDAAGNTNFETPMPCVWGPFQGKYLLACGAPNQPGYVFWTNAGAADEAASANNVEVTPPHEPLQNGLIFASLPFVASRDEWYTLDFGSPGGATFQPRKTPAGKGLAAPWAFCTGPAVWFLSDDGIYETNFSGPAQSITEEHLRPIFRGIAVPGFFPVDYSQTNKLRMEFFANEIWFSYQDTSGNARMLVFNAIYRRWRSATAGVSSWFSFYNDDNVAQARFFAGAANGNVYALNYNLSQDDGVTFPVSCRTGFQDQGDGTCFKEYGDVIIDADPQGGTITVSPYVNTDNTTAIVNYPLTGNGRQKFTRSLLDTRAYDMAFDFEWATNLGIIYQMDILYRMEQDPIRHWQMITTHGMTGWQHVRDVYISLISTEAVTLTINVDGTDFSYTIPSTGGIRKKQYVQCQPSKGKVFTYSLDCPSDFRLFGNECEVRAKSWNSALGYQLISPFQDEQVEA